MSASDNLLQNILKAYNAYDFIPLCHWYLTSPVGDELKGCIYK